MSHLGAHGVQVEHAFVQGRQFFLTARVLNVCFEKSVFVRITHDNWASHTDIALTHQPAISDQCTDAFSTCIGLSGPIQFAVCFREGAFGAEHWDNNGGQNYEVVVHEHPTAHSTHTPATTAAAAGAVDLSVAVNVGVGGATEELFAPLAGAA